jgi:ADP-ribose pyrophosphatase
MKPKILETSQITDFKWINLFKVNYVNSKQKACEWIFASRKKSPFGDSQPDAVIIVATVYNPEGTYLVVTKEYRAPINDYEYGFPAGLIDPGLTIEQTVEKELMEETGLQLMAITSQSNPIISSAGLSDESVVMVFCEATGNISKQYQESTEDIEASLYTIEDVEELMLSEKKIGAKSWGILYHISKRGSIE